MIRRNHDTASAATTLTRRTAPSLQGGRRVSAFVRAGAVAVLVLTSATIASTASAGCPEGMFCDADGFPGSARKDGWERSVPPVKYCPSSYKEVHDEVTWYLLSSGAKTVIDPEGNIPDPVIDHTFTPDEIHLYQWASVQCDVIEPEPPATLAPEVEPTIKEVDYWRPLVTVDSVAYQEGLLAEVVQNLPAPVVEFLDTDAEGNWLYVNVGHHLKIDHLGRRTADEFVANRWGWAYSWIIADATKLTIELPPEAGAERVAECDLKSAQVAPGCELKFRHSSSISPDGWFEGTATVEWMVTSNSGKYNGLGPFTSSAKFRIQVAEAMAVSS